MLNKLMSKDMMQFVDKIGEPFKTLPHLPKSIIDFLVKVAPWFALIGAILDLIAGPIVGVLGALGSFFTLSPTWMIFTIVAAVLTLFNAVLLFMAFNPLRKRELKGWVFLFWSDIIGVVSSILSIFNGGSAVGVIIGALIGFYILFEMRPMYSRSSEAKKA